MTDADFIWNRSTLEKGGSNPRPADRALAALMKAHNLAMNGGVLHAIEILNQHDLSAAQSGYQFYGFDKAANLLSRAKDLFDAGVDLGTFEWELDSEYANICDDSELFERF